MTPAPLALFCVYDPTTNHLVHTTVATKPEESIELWMEIESAMNHVTNMICPSRRGKPQCHQSWELYEAQGYKVVPVWLTMAEEK